MYIHLYVYYMYVMYVIRMSSVGNKRPLYKVLGITYRLLTSIMAWNIYDNKGYTYIDVISN